VREVKGRKNNEQSASGTITTKHVFKFEAGEVYEAIAEGKGFQPSLDVNKDQMTIKYMTPLGFEKLVTQVYLMPKRTGDMTVLVAYPPFGASTRIDQPLDYKISVKRFSFSKNPVFEKQDTLTGTDLIYEEMGGNGYFKAYPITLKSGKFYVIDMVRKKTAPSGGLRPYLYLDDVKSKTGKLVARNDDSDDLSARVLYQATKDGEFRIIATSLYKTPGEFTLTVRAQE